MPLFTSNRRAVLWFGFASTTALVLVLALASCISFDMTDEEVAERYPARHGLLSHHSVTVAERTVHWVEVGDPDLPLVVFVHGSPGSWTAFLDLMAQPDLLDRARLASIDRPGFGASDPGRAEPSLQAQAATLKPLLQSAGDTGRAILVGHSLGGPVVVQAALDLPDLVDGLVLLAPSIDPQLEKLWWFQRPGDWRAIAWMVPRDWRVSNREILPLKHQLESLLPHWSQIRTPVTVIQGLDDKLVPAANADFAERMLINANVEIIRLPNQGHFIPWERPDLVVETIKKHLQR